MSTKTSLPGDADTRVALAKLGIAEADIYDQSPDVDDIYSIPIMDGLTDEEYAEALRLRRFYYGVMMVTGPPGSGKGLFVITLLHKFKRFFGRRILLDYKPKELFGPYIPFNESIVNSELSKMRELSAVPNYSTIEDGDSVVPARIPRSDRITREKMRTLASQWVATRGEVYLKGGALGLDELKRYFHNRNPFNPMGITLGHVLTIRRHLDLMLIGMSPFAREIDAISFMPYVTHHTRCSWQVDENGVGRVMAKINQTNWVSSKGVLEFRRKKPYRMRINGNSAMPELGEKRLYDLYNSKDPKALVVPKSVSG